MFSSKDKKNSNKHQNSFASNTSRNNQRTSGTSLPVKNPSLSLIENFNNYKNQIAIAIANLQDQIKILQSYYHAYSHSPFISTAEKNQIKVNISKKLNEIYSMGSEIGNTFQQANPNILFKNANIPADDIVQYQFIYDNLHASFKTVWINLYESKEKHFAHELDATKQFLIIKYPNASNEQLTAAASFMMDDDILSKSVLLMNVTDFLIHAQKRHNEIIKLEKSLYEVNQLFIDMMVLTNSQGETIDHILQNVQSAKQKVKDGMADLSEAKETLGKRSFGFR